MTRISKCGGVTGVSLKWGLLLKETFCDKNMGAATVALFLTLLVACQSCSPSGFNML